MHAALVRKAKERGLDAWGQFNVPSAIMGSESKDVMDARWASTWREVEGGKAAKARFAAEAYEGPDLRNANVDIAGCVSRRSPHS